ncbi:pectate lyase [Cellulophaga phage phi38:2]|nr:pectate lyase [Cellulophaga phage phi38:2]
MMKTILLLAFSLCSFFAVAQTQDVTIAVPTPDQIIDTINNRPEGKKISASAIEGTFEDSVLSAEAQASLARANESITSELTNEPKGSIKSDNAVSISYLEYLIAVNSQKNKSNTIYNVSSEEDVLNQDLVNSTFIDLATPYDYISETHMIRDDIHDYDVRGGFSHDVTSESVAFPVSLAKTNPTNVSGSGYNATTWEAAFVVKGDFAIRVAGNDDSMSRQRVLINGKPYQFINDTGLEDGGTRRWAVFQMRKGKEYEIRIQFSQAGSFYGFKTEVGGFIKALDPDETILFFGDSITASTGATKGVYGYALSVFAGKNANVLLSGIGGTGYVNTVGGTQYNLPERIVQNYTDLVAESGVPDKVVIAMGINDLSLSGIEFAANSAFDLLRTVYSGEVYVLNAFNANAPTKSTAYQSFESNLLAAVDGRDGFTFIDVSELSYTKFDAVHPDDAGHATIAKFLYPYLVDESKYIKKIPASAIEDESLTELKLSESLVDRLNEVNSTISEDIKNLHSSSDPAGGNESNIINAWVPATSATIESNNLDSYLGILSIKATKTNSGSAVIYSPNYTVEVGKTYIFKCRVKVGGGFVSGSNMYLSDKTGAFLQSFINEADLGWQELTQTLSFSKTRTRVNISLSAQPANATLLIDAVELYEVGEGIKAFPEAYGFGSVSTGGRGGSVRKVTNLNNSGLGSLRAACELDNSIVIFETAGTIDLDSPISVGNNVSIYGQTAFRNGGQGITLKASNTNESSLMVFSGKDNLIVQYIRFRRGVTPFVTSATAGQNLALANAATKIMIDHCSFGWDEDESLTIWDASEVTVQNSIVTNSLMVNDYGRQKTSKSLIVGNSADKVSIYKTLIGNADQRNALFGGSTSPIEQFEFKNNLIFNWGSIGTDFAGSQLPFKVNIIGNKWKAGHNSNISRHGLRATGNTGDLFYLEGNITISRPTNDLDEWLAIGDSATPSSTLATTFQQNTPFDYPLQYAPTYGIEELESDVLKQMGVNLYVDYPDMLAKSHYTHGNGFIMNKPADIGGYPVLSGFKKAIQDSNNDGIPDDFAKVNGISSSNQIIPFYKFGTWQFDNSFKYTAIEVYAYYLSKN